MSANQNYRQPTGYDYPAFDTATSYRRSVVARRESSRKKSASSLQVCMQGIILAAVLVCVIHCLTSLITELFKFSKLVSYQPSVEQYYHQAIQENKLLKSKIEAATSPEGVEAIARNDMQLVGQGEILVRLR